LLPGDESGLMIGQAIFWCNTWNYKPPNSGIAANRIRKMRFQGCRQVSGCPCLVPEIQVIGLSMVEEAEGAKAMQDAGAVRYLTMSGPAEILVQTLRNCVSGMSKAAGAKQKR
jgi:DNA-binding NarL/FixJ family response regulator